MLHANAIREKIVPVPLSIYEFIKEFDTELSRRETSC